MKDKTTALDNKVYSEIKGDHLDFDVQAKSQEFRQDIQLEEQQQSTQLATCYSSKQAVSQLEVQDIPTNYGKCCVFGMNSNNVPFFSLGPDYPMFMCAWSTFLILDYFLIKMAIEHNNIEAWQIFTILSSIIHLLSYLITAVLNPGIAYSNDSEAQKIQHCKDEQESDDNPNKFCKTCLIMKDSSTHHCEICDVCIRGYDHHCPWTGKCIGKRNMIFFNVFLVSTVVFMINAIIMTVTTLVPLLHKSVGSHGQNQYDYNTQENISSP